MTEISPEGKPHRVEVLQRLTSGVVGLMVAFDVMNMRVPLYFLGQASDRVGDVFHAVTRLVRHGLPDVLDQFQRNAITVSDALYLALTVVLIGAGLVFLRNTWRALAKARPGHWLPVRRLGRRMTVLTVLALGGGVALAWQNGDLPWLAGQLARSLWLAVKAAYENRDTVWQAVLVIHDNKETIAQVVKGFVSAIATYVTLEVARVVVDFALAIIHFASPVVLPVARYGYAGCKYARRWLPHAEPTRRQIDWLHGAGSVAAGSLLAFTNLSFPEIPGVLWAASVPGLGLFAVQRPHLIVTIGRVSGHMSRYLVHYLRIAARYTRAHPRPALAVAAGTLASAAVVGAFQAPGPLLAVAIISGAVKAGYSAAAIGLVIAAMRGSVEIAVNVRRAGAALAEGANATRQTMNAAGRRLIASAVNLANAAGRPRAWSEPSDSRRRLRLSLNFREAVSRCGAYRAVTTGHQPAVGLLQSAVK